MVALHPDIEVRNHSKTLGPWFDDDLAGLTLGEEMGESSAEAAYNRWPVYQHGDRVGTLYEDAAGLSYSPEDERVGEDAYAVVLRSASSWRVSADGKVGPGEILDEGNRGLDLYDALVEADARNLLRPEGSERWQLEPEMPADWQDRIGGTGIEPDAVYGCLVEVLGVAVDEAERLVA